MLTLQDGSTFKARVCLATYSMLLIICRSASNSLGNILPATRDLQCILVFRSVTACQIVKYESKLNWRINFYANLLNLALFPELLINNAVLMPIVRFDKWFWPTWFIKMRTPCRTLSWNTGACVLSRRWSALTVRRQNWRRCWVLWRHCRSASAAARTSRVEPTSSRLTELSSGTAMFCLVLDYYSHNYCK